MKSVDRFMSANGTDFFDSAQRQEEVRTLRKEEEKTMNTDAHMYWLFYGDDEEDEESETEYETT